MSELVSVILPVYNGESYLLEAMESIVNQKYANLEIIIINDGSTDNTENLILKNYPDVHYVRQSHQGQIYAQNHGLRLARGSFITFQDADDIYLPDKITAQVEALKIKSDVDMVFGNIEQFISPELSEEIKQKRYCPNQSASFYLAANSGLFHKKCFDKVGLFNTQWRIGGFIDWYMRATEHGLKEYILPEKLLRRRIHANNQGVYSRGYYQDYIMIVKAALDRRRSQDTRLSYAE